MNKKKLPISVVMVVYNEEKLIERALKSVADFADEIIVIHDGKCTDNTINIAKRYTSKIFIRQHIGEAEQHRPYSYKKAKNDWVLQLDADEYVTQSLSKKLPKLIKRNAEVYNIKWPISYNSKTGRHTWIYKTCLFKKNKVYLIGVVHHYAIPINKKVVVERVEDIIQNEPDYDNLSWKIFMKKWLRWGKIHAKQMSVKFEEIEKWNYLENSWDFPDNLRLKYPILFGMVVSFFYHVLLGLVESVNKRSFFQLKYGFYSGLYFVYVFGLIKFKRF